MGHYIYDKGKVQNVGRRFEIPFGSKCFWCGNEIGWHHLTFSDDKHETYEIPYCSRKCINDDPDSKDVEERIIRHVRDITARRLEYQNSEEYKKEQEQKELERKKKELEKEIQEEREKREGEESLKFMKRFGCGLFLIIVFFIGLFLWSLSYSSGY